MVNRSVKLPKLLEDLNTQQPKEWSATGKSVRPNLHGLLQYPAMMVPKMQGDVLDIILKATNSRSHILDPFVGSGTILTEALIRNLDFTGIDINPLAAMVCEAKVAIDSGVDFDQGIDQVLDYLSRETAISIDIDFPGITKWFSEGTSQELSHIRRAIVCISNKPVRQVMWSVFAETIRLCSNSRTSTYKLHIRPVDKMVPQNKIQTIFKDNLEKARQRVVEYQLILSNGKLARPQVKIICDDARNVEIDWTMLEHQILMTSPPYGDNKTTIPYGQFSYLSLQWIPECDWPEGATKTFIENTSKLDSASLGGLLKGTDKKEDTMRLVSPFFDRFIREARSNKKELEVRKVTSFVFDFYDSLKQLRNKPAETTHWVMTTGNRTAAGMVVPLNGICRDIATNLGGKEINSIQRQIKNRRMPSRNSQGAMITTETTLIAEFS